MKKILVVEDNRSMREMLCSILEEKGYGVSAAPDVGTAFLLLRREPFAAIVSDLQLPDMDGLTFFKKVKPQNIPFIILTAFGSIEKAVEAIKEGAFDFIAKPVDPDYLMLMIEKALESTKLIRENIVLKEVMTSEMEKSVIIGRSRQILEAAEKLKQVAATDASVLLLGESGTGKELFARAIHNLSPRRSKPLISVNSASIPENLLENELFGHERGSYTGAHLRQAGKFELAQGGTFFFDEIGDFPIHLQGKILRVLEEKKISRLGTAHEVELDIRFIFATNQNLETAIAENRFRKDLYFRITTFPIFLSPLRERSEDISILADHFAGRFSTEIRKNDIRLSDRARDKLLHYPWPGNVRELQNTIERAIILCHGNEIGETDIILPEKPFTVTDTVHLNGTLAAVSARAKRAVEKLRIEKDLKECAYNRTAAAKSLGISYKTLLEKIKHYGISQKD